MIPPSVLVLGLGNDLLTDDAVGLQVVRAARTRLAPDSTIWVRESMEMGLALLDEIAGFDALVLVDSVQTGAKPPGHIYEFSLDVLAGRHNTAPHFVDVGTTLALGRQFGLAMPQSGLIVAIEVADPFTVCMKLTSTVATAVPRAARLVTQRAREFSRCASSCTAARMS